MEKNVSTNIKNYIQNLQLISILIDYRLKDMYGDQVACEINKIMELK